MWMLGHAGPAERMWMLDQAGTSSMPWMVWQLCLGTKGQHGAGTGRNLDIVVQETDSSRCQRPQQAGDTGHDWHASLGDSQLYSYL